MEQQPNVLGSLFDTKLLKITIEKIGNVKNTKRDGTESHALDRRLRMDKLVEECAKMLYPNKPNHSSP